MSGLSLDEHDVAELSDLLTLARDGESGLALPWPFLRRLKDLIGCDILGVAGTEPAAWTHYLAQDIADEEFEDGSTDRGSPDDDPYWHHFWSSPCSYPERSGDYSSVFTISDFYSAREWHSTGMYTDFLAPDGIEHELLLCLPDGPGRSIRLLCLRGAGVDFGDRERFLLTLLRPHIADAYRAVVRRRTASIHLTPRQYEILDMVRVGYTNQQIARRSNLSEGTVRTHLANIFARLDVTSRTAAVNRVSEAAAARAEAFRERESKKPL